LAFFTPISSAISFNSERSLTFRSSIVYMVG
jgi:hypothetical protein